MVISRTIKNAVSTPSLVTVKIQKENRGSPGVYSRFSTAVKQMMNKMGFRPLTRALGATPEILTPVTSTRAITP